MSVATATNLWCEQALQAAEAADHAVAGGGEAGVNGPMARRVADLRVAFEALAGPSWRDPWTVPAPLHGPELAKPIRVAVVLDPAGRGTAAQVQDGVRKAAQALEDAGYAIEEIQPPSIEVAARTLLDMLIPGLRAGWESFEVDTDRTTEGVAETIHGMRMAMAINALGLPAVALPVGIADGLPQAVQVIGPRYREDLCLEAAAALEDRVGVITPIDPR